MLPVVTTVVRALLEVIHRLVAALSQQVGCTHQHMKKAVWMAMSQLMVGVKLMARAALAIQVMA
jgi:hypothetical protein